MHSKIFYYDITNNYLKDHYKWFILTKTTGLWCQPLILQRKISFYDSMYTSLNKNTQMLSAEMIRTDKPSFTEQSGASDCGLFAIAYITHIANGFDPPSLCVFDQVKMKKHLTDCFEKND